MKLSSRTLLRLIFGASVIVGGYLMASAVGGPTEDAGSAFGVLLIVFGLLGLVVVR